MHDIFGAEVIELFDMQYDPEEKYRRKETAAQAVSPEKQTEGQEKQTGEPAGKKRGAGK